MTAETVTGVLILASLITGIWIGWRVHHLSVGEEVKRELVVFNREISTSILALHSRIDEIVKPTSKLMVDAAGTTVTYRNDIPTTVTTNN